MRHLFWVSFWGLTLLTVVRPVLGDAATNGPDGINVPGMGFSGAGIGLGQVEPGRPGLPGFDSAANVHTAVVPAAVFRRNGSPNTADANAHGEEVAGIMISTDATLTGVAPAASLYASAYVTAGTNPGYQDALLAMQHVVLQPDVWAVNNSWGKPNAGTVLDGNSLLTLGADWIASQFNVLQVIAGNESTGGIPIPTDSFNGMVVAFSERVGGVGVGDRLVL